MSGAQVRRSFDVIADEDAQERRDDEAIKSAMKEGPTYQPPYRAA